MAAMRPLKRRNGNQYLHRTTELASEKFCNWIIMRRSVNLRSE